MIVVLLSSFYFGEAKTHPTFEKEYEAVEQLLEDDPSKVFTVVLRPCAWKRSKFAKADVWQDGRTIDSFENKDEAWLMVAEAVAQRLLVEKGPDPTKPIHLEQISLKDFRNFKDLQLNFPGSGILEGNWHCVAGINGAGKSSLLEAICLLLMGDREAAQLGENRLRRMCRNTDGDQQSARLEAVLKQGEKRFTLALHLNEKGLDSTRTTAHSGYDLMKQVWEELGKRVILAFGPTRNLSDQRDTRYESLSDNLQRQMTLFDPLTRITDVEVLLDTRENGSPVPKLVTGLLSAVLAGFDIEVSLEAGRMIFQMREATVEAIDLPDGFRSLASWLAGLCAAWYEKFPERAESGDHHDIEGIVLLDEIDLHLHARLQREIVPCLRKELPKVQWVVTTHSPLVLSSFDKTELLLLDHREPGGVLSLKRQVMAMSVEQIYRWLLETSTRGRVMEEMLIGDVPIDEDILETMMEETGELEEKDPEKRAEWRETMLDGLDLD